MLANRLFILLFFLKLGIIFSDEGKFTSFEHFEKFSNSVFEMCQTGYKLTFENKYIESKSSVASSYKKSSSAAWSSHKSNAGSAHTSLPKSSTGSTAASSHKSSEASAHISSHKSNAGSAATSSHKSDEIQLILLHINQAKFLLLHFHKKVFIIYICLYFLESKAKYRYKKTGFTGFIYTFKYMVYIYLFC